MNVCYSKSKVSYLSNTYTTHCTQLFISKYLLNQNSKQHPQTLPRDTVIRFHCHQQEFCNTNRFQSIVAQFCCILTCYWQRCYRLPQCKVDTARKFHNCVKWNASVPVILNVVAGICRYYCWALFLVLWLGLCFGIKKLSFVICCWFLVWKS